MVDFGPLTAEIGLPVLGTQQISTCFASSLRYCTDVAQWRSTNFARCLAVSCAGTLYIYFWGLLPPNRILPGAKFSLRPSVARAPLLAAFLRGTGTVGVSRTLRSGIFTRQGGHPVRHWAVELSSFRLFYVLRSRIFVFLMHDYFRSVSLGLLYISVIISPGTSQEIGWEERLRNDLCCVESDVKP